MTEPDDIARVTRRTTGAAGVRPSPRGGNAAGWMIIFAAAALIGGAVAAAVVWMAAPAAGAPQSWMAPDGSERHFAADGTLIVWRPAAPGWSPTRQEYPREALYTGKGLLDYVPDGASRDWVQSRLEPPAYATAPVGDDDVSAACPWWFQEAIMQFCRPPALSDVPLPGTGALLLAAMAAMALRWSARA